MESRAITDAQITASSEHDAAHGASHARLNFQEILNEAEGGWVAKANDQNPWLQVDVGARLAKVIITGVATQGRNSLKSKQWVTKYKLQYSDDEDAIHHYKELEQATDKVSTAEIMGVRANCFCASFCVRKFTRYVMHERTR